MKKSLKGHSKLVGSVMGLFLMLSCTKQEVRFHELPSLRFEIAPDSTTNGQLAEYYIIENCPSEEKELIKRIKKFNKKTLRTSEIESDRLSFYTRFFYRESNQLDKNYQEDESYFGDVIEDHSEDLVATIEYSVRKGWDFKVKILNSKDEWKDYPLK